MGDCPKCNGTSLIPLVKDGKVIPHTFLHCECYEEELDHYYPLRKEDFDFSMSYSYYRGLSQYHGWPDPGTDIVEESNLEDRIDNLEAITAESGSMPRHYHDRLQQLEARVIRAETKLNEYLSPKKQTQLEKSSKNLRSRLKGIDT